MDLSERQVEVGFTGACRSMFVLDGKLFGFQDGAGYVLNENRVVRGSPATAPLLFAKFGEKTLAVTATAVFEYDSANSALGEPQELGTTCYGAYKLNDDKILLVLHRSVETY